MSSLFDHLAASDDSDQIRRRQAAAVATKRFNDRYSAFLGNTVDLDEFEARLAYVEDDLKQMVASVAAEYGGDADTLEAALRRNAAGGFCDDCRKWKSGPRAGCVCDGPSSGASTPPGEEEEEEEDFDKESKVAIDLATQPIMHAQPLPDEPGEGVTDINGELADAPTAVGHGTISSAKTAEALKTVKLPKADESGLGGPSPKIDKGNSGDESGWNLSPIKTEGTGSPNPTVTQDVEDTPDWEADFLAQTDAVTKSESLPSNDGDAGFSDGGEAHGDHTDTWSGTEGQAKPVTSAADPDKNPLRDIIESQFDGFLPSQVVQSALRKFESGD